MAATPRTSLKQRPAVNKSFALFTLYLALLFVFISAPAHESYCSDKKPSFHVRVKDGLLTVKARNARMKEVMTQITNQAGIRIVFCGPLQDLLTVDLSDMPLDKGLRRLCKHINYALIYGPEKTEMTGPEIEEIVIYPRAGESTRKRQSPSEKQREAVIASLFEALEDRYPVIREEAVKGLSKFGDERVIERLTEVLLRDEDEDVRAKAAKALGGLGDKMAIDPLMKSLQDKEVWVRENVVRALGQIGGEGVVPPLIEALRDKDREVRDAAIDALEEVNDYLQIPLHVIVDI